jgi:dCTP deaminase
MTQFADRQGDVLSHADIMRRVADERDPSRRLIVEPFFGALREDKTAAASLDFHLGNRFTIFQRRRGVVHDPAEEADGTTDSARGIAVEEYFVPFGDQFVLHPGHLVLGTTLEWFRFPLDLMAYVAGRSIHGRRGLLIATATAVHPGSAGTITLELSNTGEIAVALRPGIKIGQLSFHSVQAVDPQAKRTRFVATLRPVLGHYTKSMSESFLLGLKEQESGG